MHWEEEKKKQKPNKPSTYREMFNFWEDQKLNFPVILIYLLTSAYT